MPSIKRNQIAAMNIHWKLYPFEDFLKTQQQLGVKTIEFWATAPHFLVDEDGYQENYREVRKMIEEQYGLKVGAFTPECACFPYQIASWDKGLWERSIEYYKNGLECASLFGAKIEQITCCGGAWDQEPEYAFERAVEALRILGPAAADNGVTLTVETVRPEESNVVTTLPELKRLLKAVDHPNVKAAVDTCAMGVANETLEEWFDCLGSDIRHMHFIDGRPYGHLIWGEGLHPLDDYIETLNRNHYEGYLGQELTVVDYWFDPAQTDRKNMQAFAPYIKD